MSINPSSILPQKAFVLVGHLKTRCSPRIHICKYLHWFCRELPCSIGIFCDMCYDNSSIKNFLIRFYVFYFIMLAPSCFVHPDCYFFFYGFKTPSITDERKVLSFKVYITVYCAQSHSSPKA